MAVQLAARGERTDLVVLLDSRVPNRVDALTTLDRVRIKAQQFRRRGVRFPFEWARSRARWELGRLRRALGMGPAATGADGSFQSKRIFDATEQAMDRYVPPPYAGRVAFFRPPLQHHYRLGANRAVDKELVFVRPDGGWAPYVKDLEVFEVPGEPGDHDGFVLEPAVRTLVAKLRQCWGPAR
jgi:thioesterase domain-containing protein